MVESRFLSRTFASRFFMIPLLAVLALPSACKVDDDDGGVGGTTEGMPPCPECSVGDDVYACVIDGNEELLCFDSLEAAQQSCGAIPGNGVVGSGPTTCDNQSAGEADQWSPAEYVTYEPATRTHVIAKEFFAELLAEPNLLLLDDARVRWIDNRLKFETIEPGELAHVLGFENGDVVVSVNGYGLTTTSELFSAFDALHGSEAFVVEVIRNEDVVVLRYALR